MDINTEITQASSLKCSLCKNFLNIPPILTSQDGKVNKCGRCQLKGPKLTNRNTLYESIGTKLSFPCIYKDCTKRLSWFEVEKHEKSCVYRNIICPFWVCREKNTEINVAKELRSHFESDHPGTVYTGGITLTLPNLIQIRSFIKLLIVDSIPFLVIIHTAGTGERVWIGVFNFENKPYDYQIQLYADKSHKKSITYRETVLLFDDTKHCLYCLNNLCTLSTHPYSKNYPEKQKEKYNSFTRIDIRCTKNVLVAENMSFDINIVSPVQNGFKEP